MTVATIVVVDVVVKLIELSEMIAVVMVGGAVTVTVSVTKNVLGAKSANEDNMRLGGNRTQMYVHWAGCHNLAKIRRTICACRL